MTTNIQYLTSIYALFDLHAKEYQEFLETSENTNQYRHVIHHVITSLVEVSLSLTSIGICNKKQRFAVGLYLNICKYMSANIDTLASELARVDIERQEQSHPNGVLFIQIMKTKITDNIQSLIDEHKKSQILFELLSQEDDRVVESRSKYNPDYFRIINQVIRDTCIEQQELLKLQDEQLQELHKLFSYLTGWFNRCY